MRRILATLSVAIFAQAVFSHSLFSRQLKKICEGKTKVLYQDPEHPTCAIVESKNDITASSCLDKAKRDVLAHKAECCTQTACNVFEFLKEAGIPVAYTKQLDETRFAVPKCEMIEYEVIARRRAWGSFLRRHPHFKQGQVFPQLLIEFTLKTSNHEWKGKKIPEDDPFIRFTEDEMELYNPYKPLPGQKPFMTLKEFPLKDNPEIRVKMAQMTRRVFYILEKAWQLLGKELIDMKVEFGFDAQGNLLVADVIDNDAWRLLDKGVHLDKQAYRDGQQLDAITQKYKVVSSLSRNFFIPRQRIIIWRGSEKDNLDEFMNLLKPYMHEKLDVVPVTCSMHKEPVKGYDILNKLVQEVPDSIVIAYVGRSNGAGPVLSAHTNVPVITVPATSRSFPEDVWSSLRTPSETPVMTMLYPNNAVLAAIQMLAQRNPLLYSMIRLQKEMKWQNLLFLN